MNVVSTELDGFILAVAIGAVLLLAGVLIGISRLIASNKKIQSTQQNQSQLLMAISNVLAANSAISNLQARQESVVAEKPATQNAE